VNLISYNILDGGAEREALIGEVLSALPELNHLVDVVALVEADDPEVVERLANRLSMDFIHAPGNSHASALLSRLPIVRTVNHARLHPAIEKSLLEAVVLHPDFGELPIGVVHLHARAYEADETIRERELDVVLDVFADYRRRNAPHVLCGDFNANSPHQRIDPAKLKPKSRAAWEANGGDLPRRVVSRMLDAGYVDTLHAYDRRAGETATTFTTEFPGQRVDYIFTHGVPRFVWPVNVVTSDPATQASDHYPIRAHIGKSLVDRD
jgi:endonuclease/exonuclease/phosphatase family metal-dependent hydrolase